jgi:hypothetical protein
MVVVTRSRSRAHSRNSAGGGSASGGGVKILTPSFRAASTRSYKIYTGGRFKSRSAPHYEESVVAETETEAVQAETDNVYTDSIAVEDTEYTETASAAETLTDLKTINKHACMNPMHPIMRYMYRIQVFNSSCTHHYKTAFIGYNNKNRLYYVHTIISNCYRESSGDADADTAAAVTAGLPLPVNTLQLKYSSYINDSIENFVMTMLVPSREYDYHIRDDIIGVATTETEFCDAIFGQDSSYYDVEGLLHDESSNETTNRFKAFSLIPSRSYWFDPLVIETHSSAYSSYTIHSVLNILSQSQ